MVINCQEFSELQNQKLKIAFLDLSLKKAVTPCLYIINTLENEGCSSYIRSKTNLAKKIGVKAVVIHFNESQEKLLDYIKFLNQDTSVHGIIIQLPLRSDLNKDIILEAISPWKDVDCLTSANKAQLYLKKHFNETDLIPATAKGIWKLLKKETQNQLKGLNVSIVNRSDLVGKPLFNLLVSEDCTVTLCHSKTKHLTQILISQDIVVLGMNNPSAINRNHIKADCIVIDVSINRKDNCLVGDADFHSLKNYCKITPVPKGIGPITVSELFLNLLILIHKQLNLNLQW